MTAPVKKVQISAVTSHEFHSHHETSTEDYLAGNFVYPKQFLNIFR